MQGNTYKTISMKISLDRKLNELLSHFVQDIYKESGGRGKVNFISSNENMPKAHAKINDYVRPRKRNFKPRSNGNQP